MMTQLVTLDVIKELLGPKMVEIKLVKLRRRFGQDARMYALKLCALYEYVRSIENLLDAKEYVRFNKFNEAYNWGGMYVNRKRDVERWIAHFTTEQSRPNKPNGEARS